MSRLQQMRDEDAVRIAEILADDIKSMGKLLDNALRTIMQAEDGPERAGLVSCNRMAHAALAELPARIAAHGPFCDRDAVEAASRIEVLAVLALLDGSGVATSGSA